MFKEMVQNADDAGATEVKHHPASARLTARFCFLAVRSDVADIAVFINWLYSMLFLS